MELIWFYLLIINALGTLLMIIDKISARKKLRRISERNLFAVAIAGGCLGTILGMYIARHKTRHPKFTIGLPVVLAIQIVLILLYILL